MKEGADVRAGGCITRFCASHQSKNDEKAAGQSVFLALNVGII